MNGIKEAINRALPLPRSRDVRLPDGRRGSIEIKNYGTFVEVDPRLTSGGDTFTYGTREIIPVRKRVFTGPRALFFGDVPSVLKIPGAREAVKKAVKEARAALKSAPADAKSTKVKVK